MASFDLKKLFRVPNPEQRLGALHLRSDLLRAAGQMASDSRSDAAIKPVEDLLTASETVVRITEGMRSKRLGFLVLTTESIIFRWHGATPGSGDRVLLRGVTEVKERAGGMTGQIRIATPDGPIEVGKILGNQAAQFAQDLRAQLLSPGVGPRDPVQELLDLRERRASGTIDEAAFRRAKSRLLDEL